MLLFALACAPEVGIEPEPLECDWFDPAPKLECDDVTLCCAEPVEGAPLIAPCTAELLDGTVLECGTAEECDAMLRDIECAACVIDDPAVAEERCG